MSMTMYAIYDAETGEVVQLHAEPAELDSSPEEIVRIADVRNPQRLRAIRLSAQDAAAGPGRVVDGELRADSVPAGRSVVARRGRLHRGPAHRAEALPRLLRPTPGRLTTLPVIEGHPRRGCPLVIVKCQIP